MKKALFGYNVREVDENMEYLEEINAKLEKQVKQLTAELEALKSADHEFEALSDLPDSSKSDEELSAAREQIASLKIENEKMKTTIRNMAKELEEKKSAPTEEDDLTRVSQICRAAYADMADAKQDTKEKLAQFVNDFLDQWTAYRKKIDAVASEVARACDESRESFLVAADTILQQYSDLSSNAQDFAAYFNSMDSLEEKVKQGITESLLELDQPENQQADSPAAEPEEPVEEPDPPHAIFRELKKRAFSKKDTKEKPAEKKAEADAEPVSGHETAQQTKREVSGDIGIAISVNPKNIVNG